MAGLLHMIARQLFGTNNQKPKQSSYKTVSKPVSRPTEGTNDNVVDRTIRPERTQEEVAREDFLLNQIDEFREKAQKLQDLLLSKETKVEELQNIVDEKESKAKVLQDILDERQKQADVITEEMNEQIDKLIEKVTAKMSEIEASIEDGLVSGRKISEEQTLQVKESLEALTSQLDTLKADLSEKIHSENVKCYRNMADLMKCLEDKVDATVIVEERVASVNRGVVAVIILTVINMLGLAALALYELGIFEKLFG
jgi:transposase